MKATIEQVIKLKTAQIGRCGELLVQYQLLMRGIDSAPMTTDAGVDLVAYSPVSQTPRSIQVKTNLKPKPGGGKGKPALSWWIEENSPAQIVAMVDLSSETIWLFTPEEVDQLAQQQPEGRRHLYFYTDPTHKPRLHGKKMFRGEFDGYLLKHRVSDLF